jgi:hypothetical protein
VLRSAVRYQIRYQLVAVMIAAEKDACPYCNGRLETITQRGKPVKRCATCGRSPDPSTNGKADPSPTPASSRAFADLAPGSAPRPCRVEGCPGTLDVGGLCACCAKRAAWELAHAPIRTCEICDGRIRRPEESEILRRLPEGEIACRRGEADVILSPMEPRA